MNKIEISVRVERYAEDGLAIYDKEDKLIIIVPDGDWDLAHEIVEAIENKRNVDYKDSPFGKIDKLLKEVDLVLAGFMETLEKDVSFDDENSPAFIVRENLNILKMKLAEWPDDTFYNRKNV